MTAAAAVIRPSLDEAHEQASAGSVLPFSARISADTETPVSAFLKLRDHGAVFLLESAEQGRFGRYSFIGVRPHLSIRYAAGELELAGSGGRRRERVADPYLALEELMAGFTLCESEGLPPFPGGAVGFWGYDLVRTVEPRLGPPNPDPVGLPDMALMVCEVLLAFDHHRGDLLIVSHAFLEQGVDLGAARGRAEQNIAEVTAALRGPLPELGARAVEFDVESLSSNMSREQFEATVGRIVEYIHAGDAFQVVPSQRFSAPAPADAFSIYRGLRAINPSPYMYFLDFGEFQIAGASPEPLVKVSGERAETRPIAGTYPRGAGEEEDRQAAEALLADPKERAEHLMLVDLGRNDLGRVCRYGTVTVDELMVVETYSHVLHIVSQVSGRLRPEVSAIDALRAVLPAGTLSGAPKVRAMEIIDELEPHKRGSYGGAVGYVSFSGDLDTAIHIRTVVVKDGRLHVQAGGGTVADAKPDYEYRESVNKAQAVFRAIELAASREDWL